MITTSTSCALPSGVERRCEAGNGPLRRTPKGVQQPSDGHVWSWLRFGRFGPALLTSQQLL